jgi:hypothetical protein
MNLSEIFKEALFEAKKKKPSAGLTKKQKSRYLGKVKIDGVEENYKYTTTLLSNKKDARGDTVFDKDFLLYSSDSMTTHIF